MIKTINNFNTSAHSQEIQKFKNIKGNIHSIFDRAINLIYCKNKIITLIPDNRLPLPYSIILKKKKFELLKCLIETNFKFSLSYPELILKKNNRTIAIKLHNRLTENYFGVNFNFTELEKGVTKSLKHFEKEYTQIFGSCDLIQLMDIFFQKLKKHELFEFLIGRGLGLTPSGDDIINGIIFYNHNICSGNYLNLANINKIFNKTNIFSQNMLEYSLKNCYNGFFPELSRITNTGSEKKIVHLLTKVYGATSGIDTAIGLIFADRIRHLN